MTRKWVFSLALMFCFMAGGCVTPESRLKATTETFTATVNVLAVYIEQGAFDKEGVVEVLYYCEAGSKLLDEWRAAVELKQDTAMTIRRFNDVLRMMVALRIEADNKRGFLKGPIKK